MDLDGFVRTSNRPMMLFLIAQSCKHSICKLLRSIMGNNEPIITHYTIIARIIITWNNKL